MKTILVALMAILPLQGVSSSPKDLLSLQRPLTETEINGVVGAIRKALAGMTIRLRQSDRADLEILMGTNGMPHMIRVTQAAETVATVTSENTGTNRPSPNAPERVVTVVEYTGLPARRCDSGPLAAEFVIQYLLDPMTHIWNATGRQRVPGDAEIARPLEMLGAVAPLKSGETRVLGDRTARALMSVPHRDPSGVFFLGDPALNTAEFAPVHSLWIDTITLLPLRWEVSQRQAVIRAADFIYEPLHLERPIGVEVPKCIL